MMSKSLKLKVNIIGGSLAAVLFIFGIGVVVLGYQAPVVATNTPDLTIATTSPFANIKLEATSAIVYDPETDRVIYDYAGRTSLPLASITKIMTALVASEALPNSTIITITPESLATYGESGLVNGEQWKLNDLMDFVLVTSSNDGANAIARATEISTGRSFTDLMNAKATAINLTDSRFLNETGLDVSPNQAGAFGSALDVAKLLSHVLKTKPHLVEATTHNRIRTSSISNISHLGVNTNDLIGALPGLRASKTGFTDIANGNLAVVIDRGLNQPMVIVVLGSTQDGRFRDVKKLSDAVGSWSLNQ